MNKRNLINSLKLAGLMALAGLASCKYDTKNYYCPDCNPCGGKDKTETPAIEVKGDAIIINGDDNDVKGNQNSGCSHGWNKKDSGKGVKDNDKKDDNKKDDDKKQEVPGDDKEPCDCEGGIRITGNFSGTVTVSDGHKTEQSSSNWVYVKTISR